MIHYRTFRNADPPGLVEVWNAAFTGRGAAHLDGTSWTELFLFSKPYFDPEGILIAEADRQIVGFAWTGFGPDESESAVDRTQGVICLLGVVPSHRRQGIGSELLRRAETYLRSRGGKTLFAGPMYPLNPFSFGVYGGSNSPGFLDSDPLARPFFVSHGYAVESSSVVFRRSLQHALNISDGRFAAHRLRYQINTNALRGTTWWQECILGPVEMCEYLLQDKLTGREVARTLLWEMEPYVPRWNEHAIGITDMVVATSLRRQGIAKYFLAQIMRFLQEQFYNSVEMQIHADNSTGISLLRSLGFDQIDMGYLYRKSP